MNRTVQWFWFVVSSPLGLVLHRLVTCRKTVTLYDPCFGARLLGDGLHWECKCGRRWEAE